MEHYLKILQEDAKQANLRHQADREVRTADVAAAARERFASLDDRLRRATTRWARQRERFSAL